jgi:methylmalonyl-CoA mutase
MTDKLFEEFSPVTKQEWIEQATQDLKGQDFTKKLITSAIEGFSVFPFYTSEDLNNTSWLKPYQNQVQQPSELPGFSPRLWFNAVSIQTADVKQAAEEIKFVLDNGADALVLEIDGELDFHQLLKDVLPQYIQIWLKPSGNAPEAVKSFLEWFTHKGLRPNDLSGGVLWSSYNRAFHNQADKKELDREVLAIHELTKAFPKFKGICLDSAVYHNNGAHAVQETAFPINLAIDILDVLTENGGSAEEFFADSFLRTACGTNYFMELAKLKAMRIAYQKLASLYQVDVSPSDLEIYAETSLWAHSPIDPYNNMLRNTTAAMSAILGGCNTLQVHPHNVSFQQPDTFSKRMARNISSILKEESYLDKIIDPAAGSYYLENLTVSIFDQAMALVKQTEDSGGWWKSYEKHLIQAAVRETRKNKFAALASRKVTQVGVNQYANANEEIPAGFEEIKEEEYQLLPHSYSYPYLRLRKQVASEISADPRLKEVFILALGINSKPRVSFASSFFEAAGFKTSSSKVVQDEKEALEVAGENTSKILVIAGSDEEYASYAAQIGKGLNGKVAVLAGYPAELVETLMENGITHFIHLKTDLIAASEQLLEDAKKL